MSEDLDRRDLLDACRRPSRDRNHRGRVPSNPKRADGGTEFTVNPEECPECDVALQAGVCPECGFESDDG